MVTDVADETSISTGWVVLRKLQEFQELHRKLRQLCSSVKSLELPSHPLKFFGKTDKNAMDKARAQIQKYLNVKYILIYKKRKRKTNLIIIIIFIILCK
jgi:sorting nexin-25